MRSKSARCELIVYKVSEHVALSRKYGVKVVPTMIIDDEVKIEDRPEIPFVCSDETYAHFRQRYASIMHGSHENHNFRQVVTRIFF